MNSPADIPERADALRDQLAKVYGVKGRDLASALRKTHGLVPRHLRRQGLELARAAGQVGHPVLERMLDVPGLSKGAKELRAHLDAVDIADRRRMWWLRLLGGIAFNLLLIIGAFVGWMFWKGYL